MSLKEYQEKRQFAKTPEPKVASKESAHKESAHKEPAHKEPIFVIQKHDASHLHFDFRLEAGGVLKSWAVPKGPSMNPKD